MSQFYGSISGQGKTQVTRGGGKASGIQGHIRGWDVGIRVRGRCVEADGEELDVFDVYLTGGSNGATPDKHLGAFTAKNLAK